VRNWHCRYGELDIVAEDGTELVFVEVKTRRGDLMGQPEEALTRTKCRRLLTAAQAYLMAQGIEERLYRFDVVAIDLDTHGSIHELRVHQHAIVEE
jgi:putative endonuclease